MRSGWNGAAPPVLAPLRPGEWLRLVLRGGWSALVLAVMFAVYLVAWGIDLGLARLAGRRVTRLGSRVVQAWAALALPAMGLRYRQRGEPIAGAGAFVANHSSWIDIVALQRAAAPFLVSKAEVRAWPGIGLIGRAIGTMFIDRRPAAAKVQEQELLARLARGDHMALFPEGTSSDGQRVLPFKSSLFGVFFAPVLGERVAVQPVTILYRPAAHLPREFYAWWGELDFATHLRDVLARSVGGTVELVFHAPLDVAGSAGRKALAEAAGAAVRAGFSAAEANRTNERKT